MGRAMGREGRTMSFLSKGSKVIQVLEDLGEVEEAGLSPKYQKKLIRPRII